ncbi:MAG: ATP-binding protein [Anaerolineaceae bacterium]|nr:ATP-binding protein [Anaerolineaceae bacterium]
MEQLEHYSTTLKLGEAMRLFRQTVEQHLLNSGGDPNAVGEVIVAINEGLVNVIRHGYQGQPGQVELLLWRQGHTLRTEVCDDAPLFDPTSVPTPDITMPLDLRPFGGMGVHMMREFVDELHYRVTEDGRNQLILIKHHTFPDTKSAQSA